MTRKGQFEPGPEIQDGASGITLKGTPRGKDRMKDLGPKVHKQLKSQGKEAPRDMVYYTQMMNRLTGADKAGHSLHTETAISETQRQIRLSL